MAWRPFNETISRKSSQQEAKNVIFLARFEKVSGSQWSIQLYVLKGKKNWLFVNSFTPFLFSKMVIINGINNCFVYQSKVGNVSIILGCLEDLHEGVICWRPFDETFSRKSSTRGRKYYSWLHLIQRCLVANEISSFMSLWGKQTGYLLTHSHRVSFFQKWP